MISLCKHHTAGDVGARIHVLLNFLKFRVSSSEYFKQFKLLTFTKKGIYIIYNNFPKNKLFVKYLTVNYLSFPDI